jgi:hypothetical protein
MKHRAGLCALFVLVVFGVVNQCDGIRECEVTNHWSPHVGPTTRGALTNIGGGVTHLRQAAT